MGGGSEAPRIVRFADARRMPWRNGGGETVEIAAHPPGADLDAFGWRVSLATIAADGAFSTFPGVARTFAILHGAVVLTVGSGRPVRLDEDAGPLRFAGESACRCHPVGGPATALNVMVRSRSYDCAVARPRPAQAPPRIAGATTLLICGEGQVITELGPLEHVDVLILPPDPTIDVGLGSASARTTVVSIWATDGRSGPDGRMRPDDDPPGGDGYEGPSPRSAAFNSLSRQPRRAP